MLTQHNRIQNKFTAEYDGGALVKYKDNEYKYLASKGISAAVKEQNLVKKMISWEADTEDGRLTDDSYMIYNNLSRIVKLAECEKEGSVKETDFIGDTITDNGIHYLTFEQDNFYQCN